MLHDEGSPRQLVYLLFGRLDVFLNFQVDFATAVVLLINEDKNVHPKVTHGVTSSDFQSLPCLGS